MPETKIIPLADGPYLIEGPLELLDPDGNKFNVAAEKIALCRCGGSSMKPFCDGTHRRIEFKAETTAI